MRYSQKTDFAPRVGFAWRVTADGKTVIRAGYGRFIEAQLGWLLLGSWAVEASDVANFSNSITNGKADLRFPYAFPSNLAQPGTQSFQYMDALHYKDPYVQQWNFTLERDLGLQIGVRVSYDGSRGSDLGLSDDLSQVPANTVGFAKASLTAPFPTFAALDNFDNGGRSNYQALTVTVNKRMSKGLQFQVSYNHAKNLSNVGGYNPTSYAGPAGGQTTDFYHPDLDYGNVAFTRRNRFLTSFLYETSSHSGNKMVNQALGGWELAGSFVFQSGPFLTVLAPGADPAGTNFPNSNNNGDGAGRADIISGVSVVPTNQSINNWINKAAFPSPRKTSDASAARRWVPWSAPELRRSHCRCIGASNMRSVSRCGSGFRRRTSSTIRTTLRRICFSAPRRSAPSAARRAPREPARAPFSSAGA
jgi:hypothetical protein